MAEYRSNIENKYEEGDPSKPLQKDLERKSNDLVNFDLGEKIIKKTFGRPEDVIELHVYSLANNLIYSESPASWKNEVVSLKPKSSSASALAGVGVTVYLCSRFGDLSGISVN